MKTSELTGAALDWAVAKCEGFSVLWFNAEGHPPHIVLDGEVDGIEGLDFNPSTNWSQGGPIIEREVISVLDNGDKEWKADDGYRSALGGTPLEAAMRAYVASKLDDDVDIPKELK